MLFFVFIIYTKLTYNTLIDGLVIFKMMQRSKKWKEESTLIDKRCVECYTVYEKSRQI